MRFSKLTLAALFSTATLVTAYYPVDGLYSRGLEVRDYDYESMLVAREAYSNDLNLEARDGDDSFDLNTRDLEDLHARHEIENQIARKDLKNLYARDLGAVHNFYARELQRRSGMTAEQLAKAIGSTVASVKATLKVSTFIFVIALIHPWTMG